VLNDDEILALARWAVAIEAHYGLPMDMEMGARWRDGALFILQARPETVHGAARGGTLRSWRLTAKAKPILSGAAVGEAIGAGPVRIVHDPSEIGAFPRGRACRRGDDPDWVPLMKKAAGIVTDHAGRPAMRPSSAGNWACPR